MSSSRKLIILFTSCVQPNTNVKTVKASVEERLNDTVTAIEYNLVNINRHFNSIDIFLIDSSPEKFYYDELVNRIALIEKRDNFQITKVYFKQPNFLIDKGKGFSELNIIDYLVMNFGFNTFDVLIVKISARYKIKNISDFIVRAVNANRNIIGSYSIALSKLNTVIFAFRSSNWLNISAKLKFKINDANGEYLEKQFGYLSFSNISKIFYFPKFDSSQISGSNGLAYTGVKNIFRHIIYKYL